jgi:FHS family Na+ dependent glucose MFS transporter 1
VINVQRKPIANTLVYYAMFVCIGLGAGIIGPTIPSLALQTNSSIGKIGAIFLAGPIGTAIGTFIGGKLFDRTTRGHTLLGIAQIFSAAMFFLIPVFPHYRLFIAVNALLGFSNGIINTGSNTFLIWTHRDKAAPFMNALHFFFGLGALGAPFIFARLLSGNGTYREAYWIIAGCAFVTAIAAFLLGKSPRHEQSDESTTGKVRMLPYLPIILSSMLFLFFYVGAEITYGEWIFTFATKLNIATVTHAAYLTSGFWLAFTIGRLISIPVAALFKPAQIIAVSLCFCIAILGTGLFISPSIKPVWAITLGLGFFMAPLWPTGFTMAGQSMKMTAQMSSFIILGDSIGGMILPAAMGLLLEKFGPQIMTTLVFISLVATFIAFIFMRAFRVKKA